MKRLMVLVLIGMLVFTVVVGADAPKPDGSLADLESMTLDELIAYRTKIEGVILAKAGDKTVNVEIGEYVVGEQIPAGVYKCDYTGKLMCTVLVHSSQAVDDYKVMVTLGSVGIDTTRIGRLVLEDGNRLIINGGVLEMRKFTGLDFD